MILGDVFMKRIVPHLWFDKEAMEAANFYTSLFKRSGIKGSTIIEDTPSGKVEIVTFTLVGLDFEAISAGPYFKFNPSINLIARSKSKEEIKRLWEELTKEGSELMPLDEYPFCELYAWVEDRFGLTWQLMYDKDLTEKHSINPGMLFSDIACGRTEEAINFYLEVFNNSSLNFISKYNPGEAPDQRARVNYSEFSLDGFKMVAMDNAMGADFSFNEAFSLIIKCKDQEEIDYYWDRLSADPEAEQCGWIKDKFGVSWQIVPENMEEILFGGTPDEKRRVTQAFLQMKKFDLEELERARLGK